MRMSMYYDSIIINWQWLFTMMINDVWSLITNDADYYWWSLYEGMPLSDIEIDNRNQSLH